MMCSSLYEPDFSICAFTVKKATLDMLIGISQTNGERILPEATHAEGDDEPEATHAEGDDEIEDKLFLDNAKRKTYSCRSLDIDPDVAYHHLKPKDVRADDNDDTGAEADSIDHLFSQKEIKITNTSNDNEISSWSLLKSEDGSKRLVLADRDAEELVKYLERSVSTMSVTHDKNFHRL